MMTFVDSSALFALVDRDDPRCRSAKQALVALRDQGSLHTHSYVLAETTAIAQRRLGMAAARQVLTELVPLLDVHWVDETTHQAAVAALVAAGRRKVSLVDWTSFHVMRTAGIPRAFAFDEHFAEQGFELIP